MDWLAWATSGLGVFFSACAIYGYATRPGAPREAAVKYAIYRVWLPLLLAWFFLWSGLPDALDAPWGVADACDVIAFVPGVVIAIAERRHRRVTQNGSAGPVK